MSPTNQPAAPAAGGVVARGGLPASVPVLFLPVGIETRFMTGANGGPELWVRIYPDQIAINAHEPGLTQQEIADGRAYWDAVWRAGTPPPSLDAVKAPWRGLAQRYGAPRAAWIAQTMTPKNRGAQPAAPTPDGGTPNPLPDYPAPDTRDASWTKPAVTEALPDAWTVITVPAIGTAPIRSGPITPQLAVSLTPPATAFPPGSAVDEGMRWLVDFEAAVKAGMALKISLTAAQRARGFERIFVYGLRAQSKDPGPGPGPDAAAPAAAAAGGAGSATLAALLDDHHYSDGLSLVPQGAPTNNTPDASSFYARKDPDFGISFAVERQDPLNAAPADDGSVLASALGIDPATLAHVRAADGFGVRNGQDMLAALWPATLGYFLSQMMGDVFTPAQIETARQYVLAHARPRGPLPAVAIGKTPYGVLPVTSLAQYPAEPSRLAGTLEPQLVQFVRKLWPTWLASSGAAPHMQNDGDPDKELVGVLGMDASSMSFRGRKVLGDDFLWNYVFFLGINNNDAADVAWTQHLVRGRQLLNDFGFNAWDPRVIHLGLERASFPVPFPTVQAGALSDTETLKADAALGPGVTGNYIQWLKQATVADIQAENYPGPKPTALLYKILRQSITLAYSDLAREAELSASRLVVSQLREREIIGVEPQPQQAPTFTTWELLARPSIPNPALSWAEFLVAFDPPPESPYAKLADLRASLDRLAALPTAELDRLLTESLDACSHRLDVWASAVANALLARQRAANQATGLHLGCFGWVENVSPASTPPAAVGGAELETVEALDARRAKRFKTEVKLSVPRQPSADNGGYILAPSLSQAAAAAVLRNGYMTHKATPDEGMLAIDLSSARVRKALTLLEGVQQGQSLNALLGYLFEEGLHAAKLDKYTQPFRDRFPIVANKLTPSTNPGESVAASNVVDGLALRTDWDAGKLPTGGSWGTGLPGPGADQTAVIGLLEQLDDYADALGDLSIAEAVFQIMRGNFGRAGTLLDAIAKGQRPPTPDIIDTPRGGLDLTHRVAALFAGAPPATAGWDDPTKHPRAKAEPWIDAWLVGLLPDPATVGCTVTYTDPGGDQTAPVSLAGLLVRPHEMLTMADSGSTPQKGELERRILFAASLPANATNAAIDFTAPAGKLSFPDAMYLARSLRTLIGSARALTPQDLTVPETDAAKAGGSVDSAQMRARANAALTSLQSDLTTLTTAAAGLPGAPGPARLALMQASRYGVPGSIPLSSNGPDAGLADQAAAVVAILDQRSKAADAIKTADPAGFDPLALLAAIFGDDFLVLPRFTPPDFPSLQAAFGQSTALVASDPQAPARWVTQLTHARPAMARLDAAFSLAQLLGADADPAALLLGQLPATANDRWLGLGFDPAKPPAKGRVALACLTRGDPLTVSSYAGLLIDEWPERIPSSTESAALAFHYEEPKARPPQALLLAVCPDDRAFWDDGLVAAILQETFDLAKIRSVDLSSVADVGQILPALYFPLNLQGATASLNFATLKEYARVTANLR